MTRRPLVLQMIHIDPQDRKTTGLDGEGKIISLQFDVFVFVLSIILYSLLIILMVKKGTGFSSAKILYMFSGCIGSVCP